MTIEEQKKYLFERLKMESLCASEQNKEKIKSFEQATSGNRIAEYLRTEAWNDDEARNTKVYLVKDAFTNEIVYYFAINCGILYSEIDEIKLSDKEKQPFERYVKASQMMRRRGLSPKQQENADNEYAKAMENLYFIVEDADRVSHLINRAEDKALKKEEERELFSDTEEVEHTQNVQETFPAIDIKFLCRSKNYKPGIKLDFKIGVYIFWEIIVPHLLQISEMVGCKYIYLFAADNSDKGSSDGKEPVMFAPDFDPYENDDEDKTRKEVLKLVDYYQKELKFEFIARYKILKPHFERTCFTLVQSVKELQSKREDVWLTHVQENDSSEG